jgi:hypothetical protein
MAVPLMPVGRDSLGPASSSAPASIWADENELGTDRLVDQRVGSLANDLPTTAEGPKVEPS